MIFILVLTSEALINSFSFMLYLSMKVDVQIKNYNDLFAHSTLNLIASILMSHDFSCLGTVPTSVLDLLCSVLV